jgi:hypothetical protein
VENRRFPDEDLLLLKVLTNLSEIEDSLKGIFSSSWSDDQSEIEVGGVQQNPDNEKGGISRPSNIPWRDFSRFSALRSLERKNR